MEEKPKYYKENLIVELPANDILCKRCSNRLEDVGSIKGYKKAKCKAFRDRKPMDVLLGRSEECESFSRK